MRVNRKKNTGHFCPVFFLTYKNLKSTAVALECSTFCTVCCFRASTFHADLACMTFALLIIHAVCRLTVDGRAVRRFIHGIHRIGITSFFSLLKAVAACLLRILCILSAHLDLVKVTEILLIVYACLYCTF